MLLAPLAAFGFMHGPAHEAPKFTHPPITPQQIERRLERHAHKLEQQANRLEKKAEQLEMRMENMSFEEMRETALKLTAKVLNKIEHRLEHETREQVLERLNEAKSHLEDVQAQIEAATSIDDLKNIK